MSYGPEQPYPQQDYTDTNTIPISVDEVRAGLDADRGTSDLDLPTVEIDQDYLRDRYGAGQGHDESPAERTQPIDLSDADGSEESSARSWRDRFDAAQEAVRRVGSTTANAATNAAGRAKEVLNSDAARAAKDVGVAAVKGAVEGGLNPVGGVSYDAESGKLAVGRGRAAVELTRLAVSPVRYVSLPAKMAHEAVKGASQAAADAAREHVPAQHQAKYDKTVGRIADDPEKAYKAAGKAAKAAGWVVRKATGG